MRWSFGFGPFRIYGGRTTASRRATARRRAKEREQRSREREKRRHVCAVTGVVTRTEPGKVMVRVKRRLDHGGSISFIGETVTVLSSSAFRPGEAVEVRFRTHGLSLNDLRSGISAGITHTEPEPVTSTGPVLVTRVVPYEHFSNANIYVRGDPPLLPGNPLATVSLSIPGFEHVVPGNVVSFDLETTRPAAVHLVERGEDHAYRASVSGCRIDPLTGGAFTLTAPGHTDLRLQVPSDMAMRFMSLRNHDVVLVVLSPDGKKVEAFWHLARANGAEPRNPCDFPEGL